MRSRRLSQDTPRAIIRVGLVFAGLWAGAEAATVDSGQPELSYRVQLVREPRLQVRVRLETRGSDAAETSFEVSREWGGVNTGGDDITDVSVTTAGGQALVVEHPEPHRWRVQVSPGERLVVEYAFAPNTHQENPGPDTNRRPILNEHLFHAYGELALLCPSHLDMQPRRRIALAWGGFEENDWKVASSFGVGSEAREFDATLAEVRQAVYMAGEFELLRRDVEKRPVYVAIAAGPWRFDKGAFADQTARIVALERDFFADFDYPFYLVTVIPVGEAGTGGRSLGGTGLTNSFSLAMLPDTELTGDIASALDVRGLLAHEMFHNWCGHTIAPEEPEQLVYWFTEGFTDFYTRRMLLRGGLTTPDEYVRSLNHKLGELWQSPVANAPDERIRVDFWRDDDVKRLPYVRGDVVAAMVDGAIRRASGGQRSLDDLMRALWREARETGERFTTEELLRRIEDASDTPTADAIRGIVVDGRSPEIDPRTFTPCLELQMQSLAVYELGFDFDKTRKTHAITGLVPGSAAAHAGLREGQKIAGWSVVKGDPTRPVQLTVMEGMDKRQINYLPVGPSQPTPQFYRRDGAQAQDCKVL